MVLVHATTIRVELDHVLQYGNHLNATEYLTAVWEKLGEDLRREKIIVIRGSTARETPRLRVSPLGAVITHKVRITNDFSFEVRNRAKKGGLSGDTDPDIVPQRLCATTLRKFL